MTPAAHPLPAAEIFKAYDIRGIVDTVLTPAAVRAIGHALGSEAVARGLAKREIYPMMMSMAHGLDRADPSSVPASTLVHIELRADDRERAIAGACRRRDATRAKSLLVDGFSGDARQRAARVCAGEGIDL